MLQLKDIYCKIVSSNMSHLQADVGIYRLLMKRIFNAYVLWPIGKKLIFELVIRFRICDYTVTVIKLTVTNWVLILQEGKLEKWHFIKKMVF